MTHHSGFACFVGRPNAGKSTLTNALVGAKVAIASDRPQTTRHIVKGIVTTPGAQLVILDTPGVHRPRTLLGERLNQLVYDTWGEVDVIGVCLPANQRIGPGDRFLVGQIAALARRPALVALATKSDTVPPGRLPAHLLDIQSLEAEFDVHWADIVPVSAVTGENLDVLRDLLVARLPEGPAFYPDGDITDEPTETLVAELIREAALAHAREELPHSIAVTISEMGLRPDRPDDKPLLDIFAKLVVERESQKPIILGRRAERLKAIGAEARHRIARLVGTPVYLDLRVTVLKDWQRDPKALNRLGF
ncbi:MAG: GTPase Era [Propionibacteriaceae bacterium]|jgi:GTP-binding protein Era|nr:GTPase Era [Propionibacteriaceae bacterium]